LRVRENREGKKKGGGRLKRSFMPLRRYLTLRRGGRRYRPEKGKSDSPTTSGEKREEKREKGGGDIPSLDDMLREFLGTKKKKNGVLPTGGRRERKEETCIYAYQSRKKEEVIRPTRSRGKK